MGLGHISENRIKICVEVAKPPTANICSVHVFFSCMFSLLKYHSNNSFFLLLYYFQSLSLSVKCVSLYAVYEVTILNSFSGTHTIINLMNDIVTVGNNVSNTFIFLFICTSYRISSSFLLHRIRCAK